jgi:hypothetical protein
MNDYGGYHTVEKLTGRYGFSHQPPPVASTYSWENTDVQIIHLVNLEAPMRLINRGNQQSPIARQACDIAGSSRRTLRQLRAQQDEKSIYGEVEGVKVWVEVNRKASYGHCDDRNAPTQIPPDRLPDINISNFINRHLYTDVGYLR